MKQLFIILLFTSVLNAQKGLLLIDDSIIETDKQVHIALSSGISFVSYLIFETNPKINEVEAFVYANATVFAMGLGKEFLDAQFDFNDIAYNSLGAIVGTTISYFLRKNAKKYETKEQKKLKKLKAIYNEQ